MEAAPGADPVPTVLSEAVEAGPPQPPAGLVGSALAHLAGASALPAVLAGTHKAERRLGIDAFSEGDVLPDPWTDAVVDLFGG